MLRRIILFLLPLLVANTALAQSAPTQNSAQAAPIVASIHFVDAVYFRDATLRKMIQHSPGLPLDKDVLQQDAAAIAENYRKRGFFAARVKAGFYLQAGQAIITFKINAGSRARLRHLRVVGNKQVSDAELLKNLFSKPDEFLGVFKQAGVFHALRLDKDLQQINNNYYQHGFLQARAKQWKAYASIDGKTVDVDIFVDEGPRYHIGSLSFYGDLPVSAATVHQQFGMHSGDVANMVQVGQGLEKVLDLWRDRGHPFAVAKQFPSIDANTHKLNLLFQLQKAALAKVADIRIVGDPWTSAHVILRDLSFRKGDVYRLSKLKDNKQRLLATGLFSEVNIQPVPNSSADLVDVEISVTERPGLIKDCAFSIAPAYLQYEGWIGIGLLMCPNFLGQGQRFSAIGQISAMRQLYDLSLVEPRLLDSRLQLSAGLHRRSLVFPVFSNDSLGGELSLRAPLPAGLSASLSYAYDRVSAVPLSGLEALAGRPRFPHDQGRSLLRLGLVQSNFRQTRTKQKKGHSISLTAATAGAWTLSDVSVVELRLRASYYQPLPLSTLLKLKLDLATVANPTGNPVVVTERYFIGGYGSVRGYSPRSLGPRQRLGDAADPSASARDLPLGGVSQAVFNAELELPIIPEFGLKAFVFFDAGNTFSEREDFLLWGHWDDGREVPLILGLYASAGFGLLIPTGTLPLRLEWSVPLTRRPGDKDLDFFFGIGGMF